jgi:hypothetical protein
MYFLARYVRKLHPDRYYKKTLKVDWGTLFLDMIGPSDIEYVICLIKNSMHIWSRVVMDSDQEGGTNKARPLFTSGEGKKQKFGETIRNKDGMAYFKHGVNAWKPLFKDEALTQELSNAWEEWVSTKGKNMKLAMGTRKTIYSVLGTRSENNNDKQKRKSEDDANNDDDNRPGPPPRSGVGGAPGCRIWRGRGCRTRGSGTWITPVGAGRCRGRYPNWAGPSTTRNPGGR